MKAVSALGPLIIPLPDRPNVCAPAILGRNFRGNQLPDSSISLSPLHPSQTNDLHVSTASAFHQSFLWLQPAQAKFTIFRVPTDVLLLKSSSSSNNELSHSPLIGRWCLVPLRKGTRIPPSFAFTYALNWLGRDEPPKHRAYRKPYYSHICWTPWSVFQDG